MYSPFELVFIKRSTQKFRVIHKDFLAKVLIKGEFHESVVLKTMFNDRSVYK